MLKTLDVDAGYSASKRCDSWLKVEAYFSIEEVFDLFVFPQAPDFLKFYAIVIIFRSSVTMCKA